jgi:hypothetical protein
MIYRDPSLFLEESMVHRCYLFVNLNEEQKFHQEMLVLPIYITLCRVIPRWGCHRSSLTRVPHQY